MALSMQLQAAELALRNAADCLAEYRADVDANIGKVVP
jgi:hypothetical protein